VGEPKVWTDFFTHFGSADEPFSWSEFFVRNNYLTVASCVLHFYTLLFVELNI